MTYRNTKTGVTAELANAPKQGWEPIDPAPAKKTPAPAKKTTKKPVKEV